jgi:hypothetical protein
VNSPFGATTSGGQKSQSLNLYPAGDEAEASVSGKGAGSNFAGAGFSKDRGGVIAPGSLLFGSCSTVAAGACFADGAGSAGKMLGGRFADGSGEGAASIVFGSGF